MRLSVLVALCVFIGIVSAFPELSKRTLRLKRAADVFRSGKALEVSKKHLEQLSELDELQALVKLLRREGAAVEKRGSGSGSGSGSGPKPPKKDDGSSESGSGSGEGPGDDGHELVCDKSEERVGMYLWHMMETIGEDQPAEAYYNEIIGQMELALEYLMTVINECNGSPVYDVPVEMEEIVSQANKAYLGADWDQIEAEWQLLEEIYEAKKAKAEELGEGWKPICWVVTSTLDMELGNMHATIGFMKLYQYMLEVHGVDILAGEKRGL